ncbi:MAG: energy-coupling factor ABC transporter permease [Thermodesulfovibrionales bacterium]|nr:energy-coupling factor ABC transporter permease [Thermodesulfovibrionales bacterium]
MKISLYLLFFISLLLISTNAFAMHIAEGILPFNWAILWFAMTLPFFIFGIREIKNKSSEDVSFKPLIGLISATVFIISCMPIPIPFAGTCSHPAGTAISSIILGPFISVVVASSALLIQSLFLAHGGISTLGANVFSMGVAGSFAGYLIFKTFRNFKLPLTISGFFAGVFADWATYLTTSVQLSAGLMTGDNFIVLFNKIIIAFIPVQLPLSLIEGLMTAGVVSLLYKKRPDLLIKMKVLKPNEV